MSGGPEQGRYGIFLVIYEEAPKARRTQANGTALLAFFVELGPGEIRAQFTR